MANILCFIIVIVSLATCTPTDEPTTDIDYNSAVDFELNENGAATLKGGASVHVLHDLQFILKFSYKTILGKGWITPRDSEPGSNNNSSKVPLTGMGQQLLDGEGDVSISVNSLYEFRAAHLHFLPPSHYYYGEIYFQQPSLNSAHNILMMPFSPSAWLCLALLWILILICKISLQWTFSFSTSQQPQRQEKPSLKENISHHLIWVTGLISQQGWHRDPSRNDLRLIYLVGILSGLLAFTFYSASFLAAISGRNVYIRRFEHFKHYGYEIVNSPNALSTFDFLPNLYSSKTMQQDFSERQHIHSIAKLNSINLVFSTKSKFAVILGSDFFFSAALRLNVSHKELCKISVIRAEHPTKMRDGMIIRKNSFWRESLTYGVAKVMEVGLNKRYWDEYDRQTHVQCLRQDDMQVELNELNFLECLSAFLVLFTGQILSLTILSFECRQGKIIGCCLKSRKIAKEFGI